MATVDLGAEKLLAWVKRLQRGYRGPAIPNGMQRLGDIGCRKLKQVTPVDTGHLRRNWTMFAGARVVTLMNTVQYGPYVNWGHRQTPGRYVPAIGKRLVRDYVPGQHFLERGMASVRADLTPELRRMWREMFGR